MDYHLALAKNARGLALCDIINKLLSSNIVRFKQILDLESVQQLRESHPKYFNLLQLFTFKTWRDYNTEEYPDLSPIQARNLKILTLLTAIDKNSKFDTLKAAINVSNDAELEDLLIEMLERDLITGKLNQKQRELNCTFKYPRDNLNPPSASIAALKQWVSQIDSVTNEIDLIIKQEEDKINLKLSETAAYDLQVKEAMEKISKLPESEQMMGSSSSMFKRNERKRERERK